MRYEFSLVHCPHDVSAKQHVETYVAIAANPPEGCRPAFAPTDQVDRRDHPFMLLCERGAPDFRTAVAGVCAEVRERHGILMNDLGIRHLWEWYDTETEDGYGAASVLTLALVALDRATVLGWSTEDFVGFVRQAAGGSNLEPRV
ncbi:MAG TPA: hypothetical protein VGM10_17570 [Actinocrinis sp.]|jgi:hypothetical protein